MSSGSKNYDEVEPYTDSWGNTAYSGNICLDHACRPVLLDAESKEHPIISCSSGDNTQSYVTKAERDAEHDNQCAVPFFMPAIYHMYRTDEPLVDLKRHAQRNSAYNRPEKVEDFPIKVQNEGGNPRSRGSAPFSSNWRTRPNSTGKDGSGNTNLHGDDSSGNRDKQSEVYPQLTKVANPINENKDVYYKRPTVGRHPPSRTIHSIGKEGFDNCETSYHDKIDSYRVPANPLNNKEGSQKANGNRSAMYFGNRALYSAPAQQQQQRFYS